MQVLLATLAQDWSGLDPALRVATIAGLSSWLAAVTGAMIAGYFGTLQKFIEKGNWKVVLFLTFGAPVVVAFFCYCVAWVLLDWNRASIPLPPPSLTPSPTADPRPTESPTASGSPSPPPQPTEMPQPTLRIVVPDPGTPLPTKSPGSPRTTLTPQNIDFWAGLRVPGATPPPNPRLLRHPTRDDLFRVQENINHFGTDQTVWRVTQFLNRTSRTVRYQEYRSTGRWEDSDVRSNRGWMPHKPNNSEVLIRFPDEPDQDPYIVTNAILMDHKPGPADSPETPLVVLRRDGNGRLLLSLE